MSMVVFDSCYIIRNVNTKKFLKFTTKTKEQLQYEMEIESHGSFYADSVFVSSFGQAVKIRDYDEAERMFLWLNQIHPASFEILKIEVTGEKVS
jgi:hypothetical protein